MLHASAISFQKESYEIREEIRSYARTLYSNYRARVKASGHSVPEWRLASPVVRREFIRESRIELGYF